VAGAGAAAGVVLGAAGVVLGAAGVVLGAAGVVLGAGDAAAALSVAVAFAFVESVDFGSPPHAANTKARAQMPMCSR
jgi:hypothetical protein